MKRLIPFNFLPLPFLYFEHNECVESARPKHTFATCHLTTLTSPVGGGVEPINCLCTLQLLLSTHHQHAHVFCVRLQLT